MFQVIQDPVHLVKFSLGVLVFDAQLIAVGFANGAGFIGPAVPDVTAQVVDIIGLFSARSTKAPECSSEKRCAAGS